MQNTSGSSEKQPSTLATPADMERETERLQQKLLQFRDLQSSGRKQVIISSVIVILMFALFMVATYSRINENFDNVAVQKSLNERGPQVVPLATQLIIESGRNSLPTYRDEVARTMRDRGPELAQVATKRLEQLPEENGKLLDDRLQATFQKVIKRIEPRLKTEFPGMSDEQRHLLIQDFTAKEIEVQNKNVAARVSELYTNDLIQMHIVLEKFNVPDDSTVHDDRELERKFLHTMVMLLDDQVDAAYAAPVVDEQPVIRAKHPTTQSAARATE